MKAFLSLGNLLVLSQLWFGVAFAGPASLQRSVPTPAPKITTTNAPINTASVNQPSGSLEKGSCTITTGASAGTGHNYTQPQCQNHVDQSFASVCRNHPGEMYEGKFVGYRSQEVRILKNERCPGDLPPNTGGPCDIEKLNYLPFVEVVVSFDLPVDADVKALFDGRLVGEATVRGKRPAILEIPSEIFRMNPSRGECPVIELVNDLTNEKIMVPITDRKNQAKFKLLAGDANGDGMVNRGDLEQVCRAGKYNKAENAVWRDGDFNYDRRFSFDDVLMMFPNFQGPAAPLPSGCKFN